MSQEIFTKEQLLHNPECLDTFSKELRILFEEIEVGRAVATMTLRKEIVNPIGSIHGGALFSLCDIAAGVAASECGGVVTTLDSNIQFLSPAFLGKNEKLTVTAKMKKDGKTIRVVEADVRDENEKLICSSQFTFYVMRR